MPCLTRAIHAGFLLATAPVGVNLAAQSVTPRFAWPVGARAEVTTVGWRASTGPTADSTAFRLTGALSVAAHPDGRQISTGPTRSVEGSMVAAIGGLNVEAMQAIVTRSVVSADGKFLRLDDTLALRRAVDSVAAPMLAQVASLPPALREAMESAFSNATLAQGAEQAWMQLAGAFLGRTWALGDSLQRDIKQPMPGMPGTELPVTFVYRYDGVTPCPPDRMRATCWRFASRQRIAPEAMQRMMLDMLRRAGLDEDAIAQVPLPTTQTETMGFLVVDAEGFLPLENGVALDSRTVTTGPDGTSMTATQKMSSVSTYRWR